MLEDRHPGHDADPMGMGGFQEEAEEILVAIIRLDIAGVAGLIDGAEFRIVGLEENGIDAMGLPGLHGRVHELRQGLFQVVIVGRIEPHALDAVGCEVLAAFGFPGAAEHQGRIDCQGGAEPP